MRAFSPRFHACSNGVSYVLVRLTLDIILTHAIRVTRASVSEKKFETYAALDVLAIAAHEDIARVQLRDLLGRMRLAAEKTVAQSELDLSDVVLVDLEDFRRQRALSVAEALVQFAKPVGDAFDEVKDAKTANCELCRVESGKRAESEDREREGRKFVSLTWV